jgi:twin arginine-targeting protein translocase, TatA/E family
MAMILPLGVIGPWQIVIICLVVVLLFGGKKIPELMKGIGQGVKSFKAGMNEVEKEINSIEKEATPTSAKSPDKIDKVDTDSKQ